MPHRVHIENCGESFICAEESNVLVAMEALGRRGIPVGCRGGGCGVCKVRVLDGAYRTERMSRECVTELEEADGLTLACRTFATGELRLEVVGKMSRAFSDQARRDKPAFQFYGARNAMPDNNR